MNYFNYDKETTLIVDASPVGVGGLLIQHDIDNDDNYKIINYASRSLSDVEQRYSQIEREALAIYYGIKKFHIYVFGK